jgi:ABC-type uncharacterized transport system substrate-binding protein|tara:strand:+ start:1170 stop:1802 length:633 start_codon:yes stop_codon:yes gene_type:complete
MKQCLVLLFFIFGQNTQAHPHSWIGLTTDFVINASGDLTEIRQRWIFDPVYSSLTLEDLKKTHKNINKGLTEHATKIVNNLEIHNYYSHLTINQDSIPLNKPNKFHLSAITIEQDTVMILEMHYGLPNIPLHLMLVQWQVYDPTFYVSMQYDSFNQIRLYNSSTLECEHDIKAPDLDEDLLIYATSLDATQTPSIELGQMFSQMITVKCV